MLRRGPAGLRAGCVNKSICRRRAAGVTVCGGLWVRKREKRECARKEPNFCFDLSGHICDTRTRDNTVELYW